MPGDGAPSLSQALRGSPEDEAGVRDASSQQFNVMSGFTGMRVLALESRRAEELAKLITTYGGQPIVAPSMREVPLESNKEALTFATRLLAWKEIGRAHV